MKRLFYLLLFVVISGNITNGCLNFTIQYVTLYGTDFVYMLQWSTVNLPPDVVFNVQYKRYGDAWVIKPGCQNISRSYCNLTNEIVNDLLADNQYYGRVQALSKNCTSDWKTSKRFYPKYETHISQLELNYIADVHSITINVQAPSVLVRDGHPWKIEDVYNDEVGYHMSLSSSQEQLMWKKTQPNNAFEVPGLSPDTKYNISVYLMINDDIKSDIKDIVVKTLPDHTPLIVAVCTIVLFFCLLGLALILLSYKYVKITKKMPISLDLRNTAKFQPMEPIKDQGISLFQNNAFGYVRSGTTKIPILQTALEKPEILGQTGYKTQLQNIIHIPDLVLTTPSSYCSQQENDKKEKHKTKLSIDYGLFGDWTDRDTTYKPNSKDLIENKCNHLPYSAKMGHQLSLLLPFSSKGTKNSLDICTSSTLLSTVKVCDDFHLGAEMGQAAERTALLISDLSSHGVFADQLPEKQFLKHSLNCYEDKPYTLQCLGTNLQTINSLDSCNLQGPYKTQHCAMT
ncbi:interleukin-22 receptor subunit alpha-1 [Discoglossus pictus]